MAGQFPTFANACGCEQNGALLAFVAHWLGSLPATYGYYADDIGRLTLDDRHGPARDGGDRPARGEQPPCAPHDHATCEPEPRKTSVRESV